MKKTFTISPRILSHFGEDLIKNEIIALVELVKNSYDACATKCSVNFVTETSLESKRAEVEKIIVTDDGTGMDKDTIEKVWLSVGTDYKLKNLKKNACGRVPLGEKGIGRLSVHKLGDIISMVSKKRGNKEVRVDLDWTKLNEVDQIDEFKVDVIEIDTPSTFTTGSGTVITISGLKTQWEKPKTREAYRALTALNSPFDEEDKKFVVNVTGDPLLFEGLPRLDEIRDSALYYGRCVMQKDQIIEFKYEFRPWETLSKITQGRKKSKSGLTKEELLIWKETRKRGEREIIDLDEFQIGPIEFEVLIFETDTQILNFMVAEKRTVTEYLRENGGIRVYRDGVRVYDYGERANDWLGIDLRRVSRLGSRLSNSLVIGSVKLQRISSTGLREKTNREGFIENESYEAFQDAVKFALGLIEKERNIDKSRLSVLYRENKALEPVLSDLDDAIQLVEKKVKPSETKDKLLKCLGRIGIRYKEVKETLIKSANAGLNLSVVVHQIDKLVSELTGTIRKKRFERAIEISLMLEKIVRSYMAMIRKSKIEYSDLSEIAARAIESYEFRFKDHNIEVVSNFKSYKGKGHLAKAESISAIVNLLDNSIYWLCLSRSENRKISVYLTDQIKGYGSIIVSDNGPGFNIPTDVAVEPFMTGKPHNIGSGLGLHIANEIMKAMKGEMIFLDEHDIDLPQPVLKDKITKAIIGLCFRSKE
ncbi:MAG TPA: ATP-binding protein [Bacteroidota bacterium]|nr:ATP-binding protein [Bacteroidota bacterium]